MVLWFVQFQVLLPLIVLLLLLHNVVDGHIRGICKKRLELLALLDLIENQLESIHLEDILRDECSREVQKIRFSRRREHGIDCNSVLIVSDLNAF